MIFLVLARRACPRGVGVLRLAGDSSPHPSSKMIVGFSSEESFSSTPTIRPRLYSPLSAIQYFRTSFSSLL
jgi:hypothetical protein